LKHSDRLTEAGQNAATRAAFLNALPANAALVDQTGMIVEVNAAWRDFAQANSLASQNSGPGLSYLDICDQSEEGKATAAALRQVLSKQLAEFTYEYPCHSPDRKRWFSLRISALDDPAGPYALLVHTDVSESKVSEARLKRLRRLYSVLSRVSEAIVNTSQPEELYETTCRIMVEHGQLSMALVVEADPEAGGIRVVTSYGESGQFIAELVVTADGSPHGLGTVGTAFRTGRHDVCNDLANEPRMAPWRDAAKAQGYAAHASFPLTAVDGQTFGCLTLCAAELGYFQDDEISLMLAVAGDLAFAVESRRTEQARRRSEGLLRESEERYRATASELVKVLDSSLDAICSFDSQGRFVQVNKACESVWGYTAEELLGTPYLDKVLTQDQELTSPGC
jgi:PAS domain-containing protein